MWIRWIGINNSSTLRNCVSNLKNDLIKNHPSWIGYPSTSAIPWTGLWGKFSKCRFFNPVNPRIAIDDRSRGLYAPFFSHAADHWRSRRGVGGQSRIKMGRLIIFFNSTIILLPNYYIIIFLFWYINGLSYLRSWNCICTKIIIFTMWICNLLDRNNAVFP